jgi:hypothetical protein
MTFQLYANDGLMIPITISGLFAAKRLPDILLNQSALLRNASLTYPVPVNNLHDCWTLFHGEGFDVVAAPGESVDLPIPVETGPPGDAHFSSVVINNVSAPFNVTITGKVVNAALNFTNDRDSVLMNTQMVSTNDTQHFFVKNSGMVSVTVNAVFVTAPVIGLSTNCHGILGSAKRCEITIWVVRQYITKGQQDCMVRVNTSGGEFSLRVDIRLTDEEMAELEQAREVFAWMIRGLMFAVIGAITSMLFVVLARSLPRGKLHRKAESTWRTTRAESTVVRHRKLVSRDAQTSPCCGRSGTWASADGAPQITAEALADMATFIENLE